MAQESPGFVYNIKEMAKNKKRHETTTVWSSTGGIWAAESAQEGFFSEAISADNFRWIVTRSSNCIYFTTLDPDIKSIRRLLGQAGLGLGRRSQTHWALFTTKAIVDGMGVTDANLQYLGNHAATTALLDGKVDVAVGLATITKDQTVVFPSGPRCASSRRRAGSSTTSRFRTPRPRRSTRR